MALIKCQECGNDVSTLAGSCPKCGAPIASAGSAKALGTPVQVQERTSKKLKSQYLIAFTVMMIGSIGSCAVVTNKELMKESPNAMPVLIAIAIIGVAWVIITKVRIWWHHE